MIYNNIRIRILIVILFLSVFSLSAEAGRGPEEKQITVVFRYDDYSGLSSTDIEVKLIDAFQKHNVPCAFGVIPYVCAGDVNDVRPQNTVPLTPVKVDILKNAIKAGILEIALHGYSHQRIRKNRNTEFSGLDYNSQALRIAKGKRYLEEMLNMQVVTFIPPWNSYDLNTLMALEKLGFKTISAGEEGDAKESSALKFLPATCSLFYLRDAVESARHVPNVQPVIVVLFHGSDFLEIDKKIGKLTYQYFLELLDWITSQKDIYVRSIDQTTKVIDDLSARRFISYSSYWKPYSQTPRIARFLNKLYQVKFFLFSKHSYNMKIKGWAFMLLFHLTTLAIFTTIAFFAGSAMFSKYRLMTSIYRYGSLSLLVLFSIYALHDLSISYRGATIIVVLLGACIGAWGSFLKLKKQDRLRSLKSMTNGLG